LNDTIPLFCEFIHRNNSIIAQTKSQPKDVQKGLLSTYFWLVNRTSQLVKVEKLTKNLWKNIETRRITQIQNSNVTLFSLLRVSIFALLHLHTHQINFYTPHKIVF
jgi:hypothetical protein